MDTKKKKKKKKGPAPRPLFLVEDISMGAGGQLGKWTNQRGARTTS
jgi:hypothetical protein